MTIGEAMTEARIPTHHEAEKRMRELLRSGGLAQPDEVSYEFDPDEVILFWRDSKLAVIIELGENQLPAQSSRRPEP